MKWLDLSKLIAGLMLVAAILWIDRRRRFPTVVRYVGLSIANAVMMFGIFLMLSELQQFIYFQF